MISEMGPFAVFIAFALAFSSAVPSQEGNFSINSSSMTGSDRPLEIRVIQFNFNGTGPYTSGNSRFHILATLSIWNNNQFSINRTFADNCGLFQIDSVANI